MTHSCKNRWTRAVHSAICDALPRRYVLPRLLMLRNFRTPQTIRLNCDNGAEMLIFLFSTLTVKRHQARVLHSAHLFHQPIKFPTPALLPSPPPIRPTPVHTCLLGDGHHRVVAHHARHQRQHLRPQVFDGSGHEHAGQRLFLHAARVRVGAAIHARSRHRGNLLLQETEDPEFDYLQCK